MSRIEKVLAMLDVGTQTSTETGYGTDRMPDRCSRCQSHEPEPDGEMCGGCRAYLLEDSDVDPITASVKAVSAYYTLTMQERPRAVHQFGGLLCVGGPQEGSWIAAEGLYLEVPVLEPLSSLYDPAYPSSPTCIFRREVYRRERFNWFDGMGWAWVHSSLSGDQAADRMRSMRITDLNHGA